jgi:hypothetical protein
MLVLCCTLEYGAGGYCRVIVAIAATCRLETRPPITSVSCDVVLMWGRRAVPSRLRGGNCGDGGSDKMQGYSLGSLHFVGLFPSDTFEGFVDDNNKNADLAGNERRDGRG